MFNQNMMKRVEESMMPDGDGGSIMFRSFSDPVKRAVKEMAHSRVEADRKERKKYDKEHKTKPDKSKMKTIIHEKVKEDRKERKKYDKSHGTRLTKKEAATEAHARVRRDRAERHENALKKQTHDGTKRERAKKFREWQVLQRKIIDHHADLKGETRKEKAKLKKEYREKNPIVYERMNEEALKKYLDYKIKF